MKKPLSVRNKFPLGSKAVNQMTDGRTLACAGLEPVIYLWDVAEGRLRTTLVGHSEIILSLAFSPDGQTLVSGSQDYSIKVWDVSSGHEKSTKVGHTGPIYAVVFTPDGKTLASASYDKTAKLWHMSG